MCIVPALAAIGNAIGIGGTAAAGTTAAGATAASTLSAIGTGLSVAGSIYSGISAHRTGKAQAAALAEQQRVEREMSAVQDQRTRREYMSQIRQQAAELAARGVGLDSPTAVLLGQSAAQELSFASQGVRSEGAARHAELSQSIRLARAQGAQGLLNGFTGAGSALISGAPRIWPELRGAS